MSDSTTPQDGKAMPPASAGSRADQCRCGLATRLVGDGCEHCNPAMMIDILREQVAEMRLADAEREAIEVARRCLLPCHDDFDATLGRLLERLG
jgi:hypothetical protein